MSCWWENYSVWSKSNTHFLAVWYFRCGKKHETSETGNDPDGGQFYWSFLILSSLILNVFFFDTLSLFLCFLTGPIHFLLSSDPLRSQMPTSRGKHLRIVETTHCCHVEAGWLFQRAKQNWRRVDTGRNCQTTLHVYKMP